MANDNTLSVELEILDDRAEVRLSGFERKFQNTIEKISSAGDKLDLSKDFSVEFSKIEQRAEKTRRALSEALNQKISTNSFDGVTQSLIRAQNESTKLRARLTEIKSAIEATPASKTSLLKIMADDAKAASIELERIERFQSRIASGGSAKGGTAQASRGGLFSDSPGQARFQKQQLFYQANDVATMAVLGANPTQIVASQAGQISQIFDPAKVSALVSAYAGLAAVAAGGAAAIALTYKITGDLREEAERRLKLELAVQIAINNQIIAQRESLKNFKELREEAEKDRNFQNRLQTDSLESLTRRRATLDRIVNLNPTGKALRKDEKDPNVERDKKEIIELDARIAAIQKQKQQDSINTFRRQGEFDEKFREDALKREEKRQEKFRQSVEQGKNKVKELEKQYLSVFDNLNARAGANNPFVSIFTEADKAIRQLRENTRGLSSDLVSTFERMEEKQKQIALFNARLDSALGAFDLRETARSYRDFQPPAVSREEIEKKKTEEFLRRSSLSSFQSATVNGVTGSFYNPDAEKLNRNYDSTIFNGKLSSFNNGSAFESPFKQTLSRDELLKSVLANRSSASFGNASGDFNNGLGFDNLTETDRRNLYEQQLFNNTAINGQGSLVSSLARDRQMVDPEANLDAQQRLQKRFDEVEKLRSGSNLDETSSAADRKILALASGINPGDLTVQQRIKLAATAEREADRTEKSEAKAALQRAETLEVQKRIADNTKRLADVAEKDGIKGIIEILEVKLTEGNQPPGPPAPNPSDTKNAYPQ
jgi:hypothetical protein